MRTCVERGSKEETGAVREREGARERQEVRGREGERAGEGGFDQPAHFQAASLSHKIYFLIGLRMSTPPQNRQLIVYYY